MSHTLRSASAQYVAARNYAHVWNDFRQSQEDCALQPRVARNELRWVTSVCKEYVPNRRAVAVPLLFAVKDGFIQHAEVFNPGQSLPRAKS